MAAGGITLEYLSYSGAKDNPGGGCRAVFDFQGPDGGSLYVGYTFQIGFDYEPKAVVLANNVLVEGLTGVVTEVAHETATYATGKLEIYALQYGTTYDIATFDMSGTPMSDITFTPQANNSIKAKNLVSGTLADDITTSTTNILVHIADSISAQGITDFFPNPPFYITIMPKTPTIGVANRLDSEIIKITNVGHDQVGNAALTGVRAQRDTTAKAFATGDIVTVGSYCDDAVLLGGTGTTEPETPWINRNDIQPNAFALPVYMGKVCFKKQTYSNSRFVLENLTEFYKANGVLSEIKNSYYLYFTLPTTGTYVARVRSSLWVGTDTWDYMLLQTEKNSTTFARAMAPKPNGAWGFVENEGFTNIANGEYLSCFLNTAGNNFSDGNQSNTDSYMLIEIYKVS